MKSFLQQIVDDIPPEKLSELKDWCYVFPSKRAGLYFENLLTARFRGKTYFSPSILGIEDFVNVCSGQKPGDEITLVFLLYKVYKELNPNLEFEKFYSWGQILLADFDEIDRNLIDANQLYKGLTSVKEIDEVFGENEEMKEAYKKFVSLFNSDSNTELSSRFVKNWKDVHMAYTRFDDVMADEGIFHTGKLLKQLAESEPVYPFAKLIFAGFNALSKSEEKIIKGTLETGLSEVYWDCDKLFMNNENEEAGQHLRKYRKYWNYSGMHWIETDLINDEKQIWSIGCPQMVSQAKYANNIIQENKLDPSSTALIVGDELLMMPVLNSIDVEVINVTMGYPIKGTSIYHFVLETIRLHSDSRKSGDSYMLESHRILALLKNPLVSPVFGRLSADISQKIRKEKLKWVENVELLEICGDSWLSKIFLLPESYVILLENLESFLIKLFYFLKNEDSGGDETSKEIIYHGLKHLVSFKENLKKQKFDPGLKFLARIFSETFRSIRIPFSGEPLKGMQVMGFLESRALDFENVILLGVNENKLPKTSIGNTYIPYVARKAFGLATYDEHQAIYAYHFKRILQRAKNVWMLHDTEVAVDGSGEKSRYILQLQNTALNSDKFKIQEKTINVPYKSNSTKTELTVTKSSSIMEKLNQYVYSAGEAKRISPSRLVIYIDCKLRFYLQYVAKVPEKDPVLEQIDARVFGNIIHRTMELVYGPYKSQELSSEILKDIQNTIQESIHQAMKEASVIHSTYNLHGIDMLMGSVINKLVGRILEEDKKNFPFTISGLEDEVNQKFRLTDGREVLLGGYVDRIDEEEDGSQTIIDYKSGRVDLVSTTHSGVDDAEKYLAPYFSDGKFKSGFQTYFYMFLKKMTSSKPVKGAIYELKRLGNGKKYLRKGNPMNDEMEATFHKKLQSLIEEILNPEIPFSQTENLKKCTFCPYSVICQR